MPVKKTSRSERKKAWSVSDAIGSNESAMRPSSRVDY
jgi:hypothetical protein